MMTTVLLGLAAGVGIWLVLYAVMTRQPSLSEMSDALATPNWPVDPGAAQQRSWMAKTALKATAWTGGSRVSDADLAVVGRSPQAHALDKFQTALFLAAIPVGCWVLAAAGGVSAPVGVTAVTAVLLAAGGWVLSDVQVKQKATKQREEFASTLVSYTQLVSILLAGGAGTQEALRAATDYGTGWAFVVIRQSLNDSRTRGVSPWAGFLRTAERLDLAQLAELAAAMQLAGEGGAQVRESLLAKADSMRIHELTSIEAAAAANTERMGAPIALLMTGFIIMIGFPGFAKILAI